MSDAEHEKIKELLDKLNKNDPHWLNLKHYYECIQVVCLLNEGRVSFVGRERQRYSDRDTKSHRDTDTEGTVTIF